MSTKNEMSVMDRIDLIRANSVSDEDFKNLWGHSIDEHVDELMKWSRKYDALLEKNRPKNI